MSLYVFGFAVGPALWAPLSEMYGRRVIFVGTSCAMAVFVAATAGAGNMASVLVFRFLTATFGAAPLSNGGGVAADLFGALERGLALSVFGSAPFLGPTLGPIIGGFVSMNVGWRWVQGVCAIFAGVVFLLLTLFMRETYAPTLLRRAAARLSRETGKVYVSTLDRGNKGRSTEPAQLFARALGRPWVMLFREPIVLISSVYMAILYGTLYMLFPAFPIVYGQLRGWNPGVGSLPFLGITAGMLLGIAYCMLDDRFRYQKIARAGVSAATPEDRLPPAMVGAAAIPAGLFAFAWTNAPEVHWAVSVSLCAPFAFGTVLVFTALFNYQLDAYAVFAASVLAAGAILRALVGGAFPLFTTYMYRDLGVHWASSVPGFLTVLCLPFPFVMYRYGARIRMRCKMAAEAAELLHRLRAADNNDDGGA